VFEIRRIRFKRNGDHSDEDDNNEEFGGAHRGLGGFAFGSRTTGTGASSGLSVAESTARSGGSIEERIRMLAERGDQWYSTRQHICTTKLAAGVKIFL
jgi:hypothetical protein